MKAVTETETAMAMTWRWEEEEEEEVVGKRIVEMLAGKEVREVGEGGGSGEREPEEEGKKGFWGGVEEEEEKGSLGIGVGWDWGEEDGGWVGGEDSKGKKDWWRRWRLWW